ncbi:MAG: TonB family protein [Muribaculaceae bacterium]|nr:TonB family protein [Muribaculaceae bacterium]
MTVKTLCVIATLASLLAFAKPAQGQTVRVFAGTDNSGVSSYMEVFEYDCVPEKPCFPGGESKLMEFINQNRHYPTEAYEKGIQGRVTCWFIVNTDGSVSNVSLLRSVNELLNEEAIRIFNSMPDWEPGRINGVPVPVRVVRSVRFRK